LARTVYDLVYNMESC